MSNAQPKSEIAIFHDLEGGAFAQELAALLANLLRLGSHAISCRAVAGDTARTATCLPPPANDASVVIWVLSEFEADTPALEASVASGETDSTRDPHPLHLLVSLAAPSDRLQRLAASPPIWGGAPDRLEELLGRVAGRLGVSRTLDMLTFRSQVAKLTRLARRSPSHQRHLRRRFAVGALAIASVAALVIGGYWAGLHELSYGKFEFENGSDGWTAQRQASGGCLAASQSKEYSKHGAYSLELSMQLSPGRKEQSFGEAFVDLNTQDAPAFQAPLDLTGKVVSAWVYTPAAASGPQEAPNGYQLFVKDKGYNSHYGVWTNAVADGWSRLELEVGVAKDGSEPDQEFASSSVAAIGIKFQLAGQATEDVARSVYLDSVDF